MSARTRFIGDYIKSHHKPGGNVRGLMAEASRAFKGGGKAMAHRSNPGGLMKLVIPAALAFGAYKLVIEPALAPKAPPARDPGPAGVDLNKGY